jgi:DNA end-binding protein Ku
MAPRPAWKGYLKLSLVTCAVELSGATTQGEKVSFRTLNRKTGNAVRRQYIDQTTGKPVTEKNEVRGYEIEKDEFLVIEDEDIEAVQIESSHTLSLDSFVEKADVDPVYIEKPYYLTPADKVSEEAFAVIRQALENKKMAGLARIVLYQRERPCLIEPFGKGMLLTTLRYGDTVRQADEAFEGNDKAKIDKDLLEVRSVDFRGPLREGSGRPHQVPQEDREEGACAPGAGGTSIQRHQSFRRVEEEPGGWRAQRRRRG